jgi:hypothetical protein
MEGKGQVVHRCQQAIALGLAPKLLALILNQKYVGDVTIVPPLSVRRHGAGSPPRPFSLSLSPSLSLSLCLSLSLSPM